MFAHSHASFVRTLPPQLAFVASALLVTALPTVARAQFGGITLPPNGDNQRSITTQFIGPVAVTIEYSSPDVHAPDGSDRRGKIWGDLVPYGYGPKDLQFGICGDTCPWRGGANENTVFKVSHDVKVQDEPLAAGSYGLHFLPGETEWTVIFSKNSTSWGSFAYDPEEDALRVTAKPAKGEYREWLTYEFTERRPDRATLALQWEDLHLPLAITVERVNDLWVEIMDRELRGAKAWDWQSWQQAAMFTLQSKTRTDLGLHWAQTAVDRPFVGVENYQTLSTLAQLQEATGDTASAARTLDRALHHRTAGPNDLHMYARSLQLKKQNDEARRVFELNARRYPGLWPVEVGLARVESDRGNYKKALEHARKALPKAPNQANRDNLERMIKLLEEGKPMP
jgi:hypothetical protein